MRSLQAGDYDFGTSSDLDALLVSPETMPTSPFEPAFSLETPVVHGRPVLGWVAESQRDPARFLAALEGQARALGVAPSKRAGAGGTDLYHDLVARHLGAGRRALRCYTRAALSGVGHWDELSFDEIHARCTYRASWWATQGVSPGAALCVILPFGVELVVSVLAGLRLGAVVSWLEPRGPDFVANRLAALEPQLIATEPFLAGGLGAFADRVLPPDALAPLPETYSHTYGRGEVCLQLFSPLRAPAIAAVPVTADDVYLGALRDGLACLALRPGDLLAMPGFHALQHQPSMLFAAWVLGAGYVHLEERDAARDPGLLDEVPLRTLGLTPRVRDAYLATRRGHRPSWAHVVRNPEERCDWEAWRDFLDGCDLDEVVCSNLVVDAAAGGALLSSARRPGKRFLAHVQEVVPAPGRPWQLLDFTRSGQPSAADAGVYAPVTNEPKPKALEPRYLVLARRGDEYLYGGTLEPRRAGRLFPVDEVLEVAARVPSLDGAAMVPVASGGAASETRFVLIGFTGDEPSAVFDAKLDARRADLCRILAGALGPDAVPDRVELYPLYARRVEDAVDVEWCQAQYLGGLLFRKSRAPTFQRLGALRSSVRAAASTPALPTEGTWP